VFGTLIRVRATAALGGKPLLVEVVMLAFDDGSV
jgi:hypothetical protein